MKAAILCAPGLEECEALITYDVLFRAGIDVKLVGLEDEIVSSHNVRFMPHLNIDDLEYEDCDCLVLPGGMPGTLNLEKDERVQELIDRFVKDGKYVAAICAAPSILIHKGLINSERFVCYPGFENDLKPAAGKSFTDNKMITGKGVGAAFEFGYEIVKALAGEDKAKETLAKTQY
ncbi:MAG: DJ-1/PfpI family protein [Erysipelotrichaceae bacterium]|nr:DJ-1/PfpI family protein [Erysipelotrichaceae bacterium]